MTSRHLISEILLNVIKNASEAIQEGKRSDGVVTMILSSYNAERDVVGLKGNLQKGQQYARLKIVDNGIGMEQSQVDRCLDAFYTTKGDNKGTGLGMMTVAHQVKLMKGMLNIQSIPNEGTSLRIYLPICQGKPDLQQ